MKGGWHLLWKEMVVSVCIRLPGRGGGLPRGRCKGQATPREHRTTQAELGQWWLGLEPR